jgi:hypothetical protein
MARTTARRSSIRTCCEARLSPVVILVTKGLNSGRPKPAPQP